MINHKHKCIFVHPNKTGGTSVSARLNMLKIHISVPQLFGQTDDTQEQVKLWESTAHKRRMANNNNYDSIENIKNKLNVYTVITTTRNPWERILSDYYFGKSKGIVPKERTFRETVILNKENKSIWCSNVLDWVSYDNKIHASYFVDVRSIQSDFDIVCDKIGIPHQELPHKNATKHKHYTEYYDDETREIVAEKYAKDIEYFGYEFEE